MTKLEIPKEDREHYRKVFKLAAVDGPLQAEKNYPDVFKTAIESLRVPM